VFPHFWGQKQDYH